MVSLILLAFSRLYGAPCSCKGGQDSTEHFKRDIELAAIPCCGCFVPVLNLLVKLHLWLLCSAVVMQSSQHVVVTSLFTVIVYVAAAAL